MQSRHFRSLFLLLVLNLLIKPFWILGIDRNVQLVTGAESYGLYYALFSFSFWLQILLDPGLHTYTNRTLAQNPALLSKYVSGFIPLKIILSLVYFVISLLIGIILGYKTFGLHLLAWMLLNQVLASFILYFRANLAGLHRFNVDSIFSVMDRGLMILFCGMLLWTNIAGGPIRIEWFIYAQALAYGITAALAFYAVMRYSTFFKPKVNLAFLRIVLKESYPYALLSILMTLYTRIDAIMIERMLPDGKVQAGLYAQAYRLLDAVNMVAFLFATILLPVFSGMIKRKEGVQGTVNTSYSLLMVPSFLLGLASFFYKEEIMRLLYGNQSGPYLSMVFGWLMFTQLAISTVYIYGTLLTARGDVRFLNIVSAAGLLANILLNLFLIPRYGALGAVIATLATQGIVSFWQMLKARTIFAIHWTLKELLKTSAFVIIAGLSFYYLRDFSTHWALNLFILCGINLTFALILGLIRLRFFVQLIKSENK